MNYILGPMRVPFLILTPMCVLVGIGTAAWSGAKLDFFRIILITVGAVCSHISVNAINEYFDFKSGLDFMTEKTPFSGGSGTLPSNPDKASVALTIGLSTLGAATGIGLYLVHVSGIGLLPLGIFGLLIIYTYTKWVTKMPILCLIAPGLGFGPLMVMGTHFVLAGSYSWMPFIASLVPGFLVSNLLLLNQFPDVEADRTVGRRHLPITMGRRPVAWIYATFLAASYVPLFVGYLWGWFPVHVFLALATVIVSVHTARGVLRYADDIPRLVPFLGKNVIINLATPALLAIGLFIAS
jgi:1,4-dihydroxy-2-naphthoate octaprenyltransferase